MFTVKPNHNPLVQLVTLPVARDLGGRKAFANSSVEMAQEA
jgi:hypothetical protein